MEFIEMIAWVFLGFALTLAIGNVLKSHFDKRKDRSILGIV
jgi:hypothetical protein